MRPSNIPLTSLKVTELVSLRRDSRATVNEDSLEIVDGHVATKVPLRDPGIKAALTELTFGPVNEDVLFAVAIKAGGDNSALALPFVLQRLDVGGWLNYSIINENNLVICSLEPRGHALEIQRRRVSPSSRLAVSEHAIIRRFNNMIIAESPLTGWDLQIESNQLTSILLSLDGNQEVSEIAIAFEIPKDSVIKVLNLATRSGLVRFADEPVDASLNLWSLPDLWFHSMSRVGNHRNGYGGTYWQEGKIDPEPATKPRCADPSAYVPFTPFNVDTAGGSDLPFGEVVRRRTSTRIHDDQRPITSTQLGELLGRVGVVRSTVHDGHQEISFRQVPSGGALHELEIYPLVHNCEGLSPGLYHYDAGAHGLELIRPADPETRLLLEYTQRTSTMENPPQVSLFLAARFGRAMWKYESMAYALILKHVGVMYEALYLTTTAMGLAGCALGGGNSQAFAAASGLPMFVEGGVGEFTVGSRQKP
jgi:SagB-type dehydrogenase family enzyme